MHYPHTTNADYILTCTLSMWLLVMFSEDVNTTPLFSEQDELDQRTSMIGTAIAADDEEVLVILRRMKSAISHFVGHKKYMSARE